MRGKIVLLYESDQGKALCDIASYVLTQVALAFGHPLSLPLRRCAREEAVSDDVLDLCDGADAVLAGESSLTCLPALAEELQCNTRVRELRYAHLIENHALMGAKKPLNAVVVQALGSWEESLLAAGKKAYEISGRDALPIMQVAPTGKLAEAWKQAMEAADSRDALFHARESALARVIPDMVYHPDRIGVILCPPYAGGILSDAAAALCGAPGMCYDSYTGGECGVYAPLYQESDDLDTFGMLRAVLALLRGLRLERESACLEAAIRNVLQAGWRTPDIYRDGAQLTDAQDICDLICQQIEVAGEWINNG